MLSTLFAASLMFSGTPTDQLLDVYLKGTYLTHECTSRAPAPQTRAQLLFVRRELVSRIGADGLIEAYNLFLPGIAASIGDVPTELCRRLP